MSGAASTGSSLASHLSNSALNLVALRDYYRAELATLLDTPAPSSVKKALVLDKSLSGPLGLVAEVDLLRSHGVDKIYHLLPGELFTPCLHVMYLVRPLVPLMRMIAQQIHILRQREPNVKRTYSVFFVPRKSYLCERVLEEEGVKGDIQHLLDYPLDLIPFEEDVLSMEHNLSFKEVFLDGDPTSLLYIARSLMKLQAIFGIIPTIKGKGHNALKVFYLLQRLRREAAFGSVVGSASPLSTDIDSLIILDRSCDLVTPMLTQLSYEGLIDEIFGIKNSYIEVEAELLGTSKDAPPSGNSANPSGPPAMKKFLLNSADSLFKETRDLNFRVLGPLLHRKAEYIKETYKERHTAQTVNEMHSFMQKFKTAHAEHTLLQTHINLAEKISLVLKNKLFDQRLEVEKQMREGQESDLCEEYVETAIYKQEPILQVLRLLCLLSLTHGIKPKKFEFFKHEFLQTYGYEHYFTLANLEKVGLFVPNTGKRNYSAIRKAFRLINPTVDLNNPNDISYLFNGYAPLLIRLVEAANKGWRRLDEILSLLPGKTFEFQQDPSFVPSIPTNLCERVESNLNTSSGSSGSSSSGSNAGADSKNNPNNAANANASNASAAGVNAAAAGGAGSQSANKDDLVNNSGRRKPLSLVVIVGGITMSEISALRLLSEKEEHNRDYIIATTKLINGNTFIETLQETINLSKLNRNSIQVMSEDQLANVGRKRN